MTIQQIVRNILERAIEDGLVEMAEPPEEEEMRDEWEPQQFSAEALAGCVAILTAWLRRKGVEAGQAE